MGPLDAPLLFGGQRAITDLRFADLSFAAGAATYGALTDVPGFTFARASAGRSLDGSLSFASGVPRIVPGLGILIEEARTNRFLNSAAPVTQDVTITAVAHTITVWGSGSVTVTAGTATISNGGAVTAGSPRTIGCTVGGTITVTVTGSPTYVQVEAGSFGTSPIVTEGTAVTRAADNAQITGLTLGGSGALLIEAMAPDRNAVLGAGGINPVASCLANAAGTSAVLLSRINTSNVADGTVRSGGSVVASMSNATAWANGATQRGAIRYGLDDFAFAFTGADIVTDTSGAAPSLDRLNIGQGRATGTGFWNNYVRRIIVLSTPYTNAQLQGWAA